MGTDLALRSFGMRAIEQSMGILMHRIIRGAAFAAALAMPLAAQAQIVQGTANGAANGAAQGNAVGGPIGGIVGGAIGAGVGAATGAVGTAAGIVGDVFGAGEEPRFHDYVVTQRRPSYRYKGDVRVGSVLPRQGVTYYAVPREYRNASRYRYAIINDQTVLVDPATGQIIDVVE